MCVWVCTITLLALTKTHRRRQEHTLRLAYAFCTWYLSVVFRGICFCLYSNEKSQKCGFLLVFRVYNDTVLLFHSHIDRKFELIYRRMLTYGCKRDKLNIHFESYCHTIKACILHIQYLSCLLVTIPNNQSPTKHYAQPIWLPYGMPNTNSMYISIPLRFPVYHTQNILQLESNENIAHFRLYMAEMSITELRKCKALSK